MHTEGTLHRRGTYIWTRFTTDNQRDESNEAQERKVRQLFDRLDIAHTGAVLIAESAERGDDDNRREFVEFLKAIERGEVKVCGVDEMARFTRGLNAEAILNDIVFHGGRFVSCCGVDTDRPGWQELVGIKQVSGRMEIRITGARVRRSQEMRVEKPNGSAGDYPYGYTSEFEDEEAALKYNGRGPKPAKIVIFELAAKVLILIIFQRFVIDNWSISKIVKWWESVKDQYPPITKTKIRAQHVRRILSNKKYMGEWTYGATTTLRDSHGRKERKSLRPHQSATVVQRPELRIVPDELWEPAQVKLAKLKEIYGMKPAGKRRGPAQHYKMLYASSPIAGNIYCHECGARLNVTGSNKGVKRLGCPNHAAGTCPVATRVDFAKAEAAILNTVASVVSSYPEWMAEAVKSMRDSLARQALAVPSHLKDQEERLGKIESEIKNLINFIKNGSDVPEIHKELNALKEEQGVLQKNIRHLTQLVGKKKELPTEQWVRDQFADLANVLRDGGSGVAQIVRELVSKITAEEIKAPGKQRGYMRLRFRINGWAAIKQALSTEMSPYVIDSLKSSDGTMPMSGEFVIDLGVPTKMDKWAPLIVQWRAEKVTWAEIVKRTGLKLANAYLAYKRLIGSSDTA